MQVSCQMFLMMIIYTQKQKMSNPANYSPYNKTYKFLLFQNQAYHEKNKINAKPCVRTNLRYRKDICLNKNELNQSNPEIQMRRSESPIKNSQYFSYVDQESPMRRSSQSFFSGRELKQSDVRIDKPKRVIHKHHSYQYFKNKRVERQNQKMVDRIIVTSCEVIKKKQSLNSFNKHLKYRQIRNKYDLKGYRKHALVVGNHELLCPTLKEYNESGLAGKFVEGDLSWARRTTSTRSYSIRKSKLQN